MLRNNRFMSGLGAGMVAGAALLQLMNVVNDAGKGIPADAIEIRKQAANLGLQVYAKDEKLYTEQQLQDKVKQAEAALKPATDAEAAAIPAGSPKPGDSPKPADGQPSGAGRTVVFVSEGMTAAQVSLLLAQAGVINDAQAFQNELTKQGKSVKILSGAHSFVSTESTQSIIDRLTVTN